MRQPEERVFDLDGISLAARYWPGEGVPLLALHGWLDNAASFQPLAELLENPVLALDQAGHGHSGHRPAGQMPHFVDYVRDVQQVLAYTGWQKCVLLGHSMGAGVASLFAGAFPGVLRALVLVEGLGPLSEAAEEAPARLRRALEGMGLLGEKEKRLYASRKEAVQARMGGFGGLGEQAAGLLCERALQAVEGGWQWRADPRLRLATPLRMTEEQVASFLRAIECPVLLISGDQGLGAGDAFVHRTALVPDLEEVRLEGSHHLHMENPVPVADALRGFLHRGGG